MSKLALQLLVGLVLMVGPFAIPPLMGVEFPFAGQAVVSTVGLIIFLVGAILLAITKLYVRTRANEAFVRTGMGGRSTIVNGGAFVIPVVHEVVWIPLETIRLDVARQGTDALITSDKLRADLKAEFYIRVQPEKVNIEQAATSLGSKGRGGVSRDLEASKQAIADLVVEKLVSALRSVAANKSLEELNSKRDEFATQVKDNVEGDLFHNGLTLESVTVSHLDQTNPQLLNSDNVFDAQGLKRIAEITQNAMTEKNRLVRENEELRKRQDVDNRKHVLALEQDQAEAEAEQAAEIKKANAEQQAEAEKFEIQQRLLVEQQAVEKERAVEQSKIEAEQKLIQVNQEKEITEVERQRAIRDKGINADKQIIVAEQEKELAQKEREKLTETAERVKQIAIEQREAERAAAQAERLRQEAQKEMAAQEILTVQMTEEAKREGEKELIAASKKAEQERYKKQVDADIVAYTAIKEAEGEQKSADLEKQAILTKAEADQQAKLMLAEADAEAAKKRAKGSEAEQLVEVNVERERVNVEAQRVEVERARVQVRALDLENQEKFGRAALDFELEKKRIEAEAQVRTEAARAFPSAFGSMGVQIWGGEETAETLFGELTKGLGFANLVNGFFNGANATTKATLGAISDVTLNAVAAGVEKLTGKPVPRASLRRILEEGAAAEAESKVITTTAEPSGGDAE